MPALAETPSSMITQAPTTGSERWFRAFIAAIIILFGVMIVIASLGTVIWGTNAPWNWIGALTGVLAGVLIVAIVLHRMVSSDQEIRGRGIHEHHARRHSGYDQPASGNSAGDQARIRYARGDISREQYQQIMRDLEVPSNR